MNLERSSVQIVHSCVEVPGRFFCQVRSTQFLRVDFLSEFGLEKSYRNTLFLHYKYPDK